MTDGGSGGTVCPSGPTPIRLCVPVSQTSPLHDASMPGEMPGLDRGSVTICGKVYIGVPMPSQRPMPKEADATDAVSTVPQIMSTTTTVVGKPLKRAREVRSKVA